MNYFRQDVICILHVLWIFKGVQMLAFFMKYSEIHTKWMGNIQNMAPYFYCLHLANKSMDSQLVCLFILGCCDVSELVTKLRTPGVQQG